MCDHAHKAIDSNGSIDILAGEVMETIQSRVVCLDCGAEIPPTPTDEDLALDLLLGIAERPARAGVIELFSQHERIMIP